MTKSYDAIIIGGGHNGLVNAAYLARAGKNALVLERRHLVGGAAVTEEVFPGFKFTEFSYVVSLLRPEIIRDLDLPGHGLRILPLESTLTPLPNGDYLAMWGDHDKTRREVYRHSPRDAEALDEFGILMQHMAMAVKPILSMIPPDPTSLSPRELMSLLRLGKHFRDLGGLLAGAGLVQRPRRLDAAELGHLGGRRRLGKAPRQQEVAGVAARDADDLAPQADLLDVREQDDVHRPSPPRTAAAPSRGPA